jgi:hypothetical protein
LIFTPEDPSSPCAKASSSAAIFDLEIHVPVYNPHLASMLPCGRRHHPQTFVNEGVGRVETIEAQSAFLNWKVAFLFARHMRTSVSADETAAVATSEAI